MSTIKETIRAEIERRFWDYGTPLHDDEVTKKVDEILDIIDETLPEQREAPVDGEVHHVMNCHYVATDNTQLCARLREFPEGAKVDIFIAAKEAKMMEKAVEDIVEQPVDPAAVLKLCATVRRYAAPQKDDDYCSRSELLRAVAEAEKTAHRMK